MLRPPQHLLASDGVPSLQDLLDLARSLRSYRAELEERSKQAARQAAEASTSGSALENQVASSSRTDAAPVTGAKIYDSARAAAPSTPSKAPRRPSSASRGSGAPGSFGGQAVKNSPSQKVRQSSAVTGNATDDSLPQDRSKSRPAASRNSSTVSPLPEDVRVEQASSSSGIFSDRSRIKLERDATEEPIGAVEAISLQSGPAQAPRPRGPGTGDTRVEVDDEAPPSRPGRGFVKAKRKRRSSSAGSGSQDLSDQDEPADEGRSQSRQSPGDTLRTSAQQSRTSHTPGERPTPSGQSAGLGEHTSMVASPSTSKPRHLGIRLKLNPTAAPSGIAALGAAHRPTGVHPTSSQDAGRSGANDQVSYGNSALWTLPEETAATIIPPAPVSRPPKPYPTDPAEVDEDFTSMDWKERERQRDKDEMYQQAHSAPASPAPGQTHLHKENAGPSASTLASAAANRARSQNLQQVSYQTFQSSIDSWFKTLTEEDVAWLGRPEDDPTPFQIPAVGRHYKAVWAEEDLNGGPSLYSALGGAVNLPSSNGKHASTDLASTITRDSGPGTPAFDPRQLSDEHAFALASDEAKGGPLTERVLSMILPSASATMPEPSAAPNSSHDEFSKRAHMPPAERSGRGPSNGLGAPNGVSHGPNGSSASPLGSSGSKNNHQDLAQYEERIKKELRFLDILGDDEEVDWANRQDDEITTALRKAQHLLRKQIIVNDRRKSRLKDIAMDRLAYQDYAGCLANVEKLIEQGWMKRQTLLKKLTTSKRKHQQNKSNNSSAESGAQGAVRSGTPLQSTNGRSPRPQESSHPDSDQVLSGMSGYVGSGSNAASVASPRNLTAEDAALTSSAGASLLVPVLTNRLAVPPLADSLVSAMQKRRDLQGAFEPLFREMLHAKRTPTSSVFADLDLDV